MWVNFKRDMDKYSQAQWIPKNSTVAVLKFGNGYVISSHTL